MKSNKKDILISIAYATVPIIGLLVLIYELINNWNLQNLYIKTWYFIAGTLFTLFNASIVLITVTSLLIAIRRIVSSIIQKKVMGAHKEAEEEK